MSESPTQVDPIEQLKNDIATLRQEMAAVQKRENSREAADRSFSDKFNALVRQFEEHSHSMHGKCLVPPDMNKAIYSLHVMGIPISHYNRGD